MTHITDNHYTDEELNIREVVHILPSSPLHLTCHNVSILRGDDNILLRHFTHSFAQKTITHIIGKNGSGKTSFLRMFGRAISLPFQGISPLNLYKWILVPIAYFGHDDGIKQTLTAKENIYLQAQMFGITTPHKDDYVTSLIEDFRIKDLLDIPVRYLSRGQKRRVALVCFFFTQIRAVYLLDEPTTGLDKNSVQRFYDFLQVLKHDSIILLTAHHDIEMAVDKVLNLEEYACSDS